MKYFFTSVNGRRDKNEDAHNRIINLNGEFDKNKNLINFFGIYDGHGGNKVSKFLEKNMPKIYLNKNLTFPLSKQQHYKIFNDLQKKIIETKDGFESGSTSLICIFYRYNDDLYINTLNLGDCRCVFVYNDDKIKVITTDHKPNEINEKKRIKNLGGKIWKDEENTFRIKELSVSRCFGDNDTAPYISQQPDITIHKITNNLKYIVLGCDGLYDVINNDEIPELLKNFKGKNYAVELVKYVINKGTTDNVSVIVIEL